MKVRRTLKFVLALSMLVSGSVSSPLKILAASTHNHVKLVHFTFRNDTGTDISIRCRDQLIPVKAKGSVPLALPEGSSVTAEQSFASYSAGEVLVHVAKSLDGNTIVVH